MRDYLPYADYTAEDLLGEDSFRAWAYGADDPFWAGFAQVYPAKAAEVKLARELLLDLEAEAGRYRLSPAQLDARMRPLRAAVARRRIVARAQRRRLLSVAASVCLLLVAALWFVTRGDGAEEFVTDFGQTREITLPDGTVVTLNANSRLRVPELDWTRDDRTVWLQGEAFFSVRKGARVGQRFTVETEGEEASIEVLGTEFNVSTRFTRTDVVLREGSVLLRAGADTVRMAPGEQVVYEEAAGTLRRTRVEPEVELAWMRGVMRFDSEPLGEVLRELEALTGVRIVLEREDLRDEVLSLTVDTTSVDEFFDILQSIEGDRLTVERRDGGYIIR